MARSSSFESGDSAGAAASRSRQEKREKGVREKGPPEPFFAASPCSVRSPTPGLPDPRCPSCDRRVLSPLPNRPPSCPRALRARSLYGGRTDSHHRTSPFTRALTLTNPFRRCRSEPCQDPVRPEPMLRRHAAPRPSRRAYRKPMCCAVSQRRSPGNPAAASSPTAAPSLPS